MLYKYGKIKVTTVIPERISGLETLAKNLWWTWNHEAIDLFREIDLALWEKTDHNPVRFIQEVSIAKLEEKLSDAEFLERYDSVMEKFNNYMNTEDTWFSRNYPDYVNENIIYFSAEYGIHEILPIYSGGLGVLSADHCKSASDLGIPFIAIGLLYKQGYFEQYINREGLQEAHYKNLDHSRLPLIPVYNSEGFPLTISVEIMERNVHARAWRIDIGRTKLYLLDTDVPENNEHDRNITGRLYGGDRETRIQQEIVLGIGGIRLLDALNIRGTVYHINEGHSAFMTLELARKLITEKNLSFREAKEIVSSSTIFTTHTPVPAGSDIFPLEMIDRYFGNYWPQLGIHRDEFVRLGFRPEDPYGFNMAVLALNMSGQKNGVSKLHGIISRIIYKSLWPDIPEDEVPINHITNGVHTMTWLAPNFRYLFDKYLPSDWQSRMHDPTVWEDIDKIPDEEIWKTHMVLKARMVHYISDKLKKQYLDNGFSLSEIRNIDSQINIQALTIGFARRFATYKRADLIFRDLTRIEKILNNKGMPVQIIFAGKAHPADRAAHETIKKLHDIARREGYKGKIFLVENYNIEMARYLVQGVDVWLNNPRRPWEASGTSGQKASINGVLNFSILDGWWQEGYNGLNGWAIGKGEDFQNEHQQDEADSKSLYEILEKEIIPLFYERNENGIPVNWVKRMKEAIKSLAPVYGTHRMVSEYTEKMYIPAALRAVRIFESQFDYVRKLVEWKEKVLRNWNQVFISARQDIHGLLGHSIVSGQKLILSATVHLGALRPEDVIVETYYGEIRDNMIVNAKTKEMKLIRQVDKSEFYYECELDFHDGGEYGYTFRVIPVHPNLMNKFDMSLIKWTVS